MAFLKLSPMKLLDIKSQYSQKLFQSLGIKKQMMPAHPIALPSFRTSEDTWRSSIGAARLQKENIRFGASVPKATPFTREELWDINHLRPGQQIKISGKPKDRPQNPKASKNTLFWIDANKYRKQFPQTYEQIRSFQGFIMNNEGILCYQDNPESIHRPNSTFDNEEIPPREYRELYESSELSLAGLLPKKLRGIGQLFSENTLNSINTLPLHESLVIGKAKDCDIVVPGIAKKQGQIFIAEDSMGEFHLCYEDTVRIGRRSRFNGDTIKNKKSVMLDRDEGSVLTVGGVHSFRLTGIAKPLPANVIQLIHSKDFMKEHKIWVGTDKNLKNNGFWINPDEYPGVLAQQGIIRQEDDGSITYQDSSRAQYHPTKYIPSTLTWINANGDYEQATSQPGQPHILEDGMLLAIGGKALYRIWGINQEEEEPPEPVRVRDRINETRQPHIPNIPKNTSQTRTQYPSQALVAHHPQVLVPSSQYENIPLDLYTDREGFRQGLYKHVTIWRPFSFKNQPDRHFEIGFRAIRINNGRFQLTCKFTGSPEFQKFPIYIVNLNTGKTDELDQPWNSESEFDFDRDECIQIGKRRFHLNPIGIQKLFNYLQSNSPKQLSPQNPENISGIHPSVSKPNNLSGPISRSGILQEEDPPYKLDLTELAQKGTYDYYIPDMKVIIQFKIKSADYDQNELIQKLYFQFRFLNPEKEPLKVYHEGYLQRRTDKIERWSEELKLCPYDSNWTEFMPGDNIQILNINKNIHLNVVPRHSTELLKIIQQGQQSHVSASPPRGHTDRALIIKPDHSITPKAPQHLETTVNCTKLKGSTIVNIDCERFDRPQQKLFEEYFRMQPHKTFGSIRRDADSKLDYAYTELKPVKDIAHHRNHSLNRQNPYWVRVYDRQDQEIYNSKGNPHDENIKTAGCLIDDGYTIIITDLNNNDYCAIIKIVDENSRHHVKNQDSQESSPQHTQQSPITPSPQPVYHKLMNSQISKVQSVDSGEPETMKVSALSQGHVLRCILKLNQHQLEKMKSQTLFIGRSKQDKLSKDPKYVWNAYKELPEHAALAIWSIDNCHAELSYKDDQLLLRIPPPRHFLEKTPTNETSINGEVITDHDAHEIKPGAVIQLGPLVRLTINFTALPKKT